MEKYNLEMVHTYNVNNKKSFFSLLNEKVPTEINNQIIIYKLVLLYESLKYTDHPDIQEKILGGKDNYIEIFKDIDKKYIRSDWENIKVDVMYYCLRLGLVYFPMKIGDIIRETEDMDIVELNKDDDFWGVKKVKGDNSNLVGQNIRGKLWMKLREFYWNNDYDEILKLEPLEIANFNLIGKKIQSVSNPYYKIFDLRKKNNVEEIGSMKKWEKKVKFV